MSQESAPWTNILSVSFTVGIQTVQCLSSSVHHKFEPVRVTAAKREHAEELNLGTCLQIPRLDLRPLLLWANPRAARRREMSGHVA